MVPRCIQKFLLFICNNVEGFALKKDQDYLLQIGDVLEILLGKHFYEIVFETDSTSDRKSDAGSTAPPVTTEKDINGVWESVDDGKLLIFTPNNVKASNKVYCYKHYKQNQFDVETTE